MRPGVPRSGFDSSFTLDKAQAAAADALAASDSRGVYLWGPAGRGKTWLLDHYVESVTGVTTKRVHFHSFFRDLHASYFRHGFSLTRALDELLGDIAVLCFDELHVHDIGDASLLARMLDELFARGVTLVATSNYPPAGLLPNPLFHEAFAPTIALLESRMQVIAVDGPLDYRAEGISSTRFSKGTWSMVDASSGWSFTELCVEPRSTGDYLAMIEGLDSLTVRDIPALKDADDNAVQRFCNLIDVLYDADVPTQFHATVPLASFTAGCSSLDIARTSSRLSELAAESKRDTHC